MHRSVTLLRPNVLHLKTIIKQNGLSQTWREGLNAARHHAKIHQSLIALTIFVLLHNILTAQAATSTAGLPEYVASDPYQVADTVRLLSNYTPGINEDPDEIAYTLEGKTSGNFLTSLSLVASQASDTDATPPESQTTSSPTAVPRLQEIHYNVKFGDTLSEIATQFNLKVATVKVKNNLNDVDSLKPGQDLVIPSQDLSDKAIQAAADRKQASAALAEENSSKGKKISNQKPRGGLGLVVPIASKGISRGVQPGHDGIDYRADVGTSVYAAANGVVAIADSSGWNGGFGKTILIACAGGMTNRYGHLSEVDVSPGQTIKQGQFIGKSGNTGNSTGPHLHFEVRVNGRVRNPF